MHVFQIGFNRCATTSLFRLFKRNSIPAIQFTGQKRHNITGPEPLAFNAQRRIHDNMQKGRPACEGLEDFVGFFDMSCALGEMEIENFKRFETLYACYPDAKFILNVRSKMHWLRSRVQHGHGVKLLKSAERHDMSTFDTLHRWGQEFDNHNQAVRDYFADKPGSLIEFHIELDPIEKLVNFLAPHVVLDPKKWEHRNASILNAKEKAAIYDKLFEVQPDFDPVETWDRQSPVQKPGQSPNRSVH